jgi:riboflavin biosynthesis pyrimidine reductase
MSSIQGIGSTFPIYTANGSLAPKTAAQPAPASGSLLEDTVEISSAGAAASQSYLEKMLSLLEDTPEQLALLAEGGNTLAKEILAQRSQKLPGTTPLAAGALPQ